MLGTEQRWTKKFSPLSTYFIFASSSAASSAALESLWTFNEADSLVASVVEAEY